MGVGVHLDRRQLARAGGLCAVAAAGLTILNGFILSSGGPGDVGESAAQIVKDAAGQHNGMELGAFADSLGVGTLLIFVVILGRLAEPTGGVLSRSAAFMTAVFFAIDVVWAGTQFALADATTHNADGSGVRALFLLSLSMLTVIAIPIGLQYVALGLLIVRTRVLPAVLGWSAFVVAAVTLAAVVAIIYSVLDPLPFVAYILATILWPLAAGTVLLVRARRADTAQEEGAPRMATA